MQEYPSGNIADIALIHAENMESSGICRVRHGAIVGRLKELDQTATSP
jgi:hypothetical protein